MIEIVERQSVAGKAPAELLRARGDRLLEALEVAEAEVDLLLTDDAEIRALNKQWRDKDAPTDVLSFPQSLEGSPVLPPGAPRMLGDVAISVETAERQRLEGCLTRLWSALGDGNEPPAWSLADELTFLLLHGVLHLLGYDHIEPGDADVMFAREAELLPLLLERPR